ncbi:MAG: VOC family protein [Pseudomonadota bacterium]
MSKVFGEIRQLAFVVKNIDEAMKYWAEVLGVGPFFIKRKIEFSNYIYRGQSTKSPQISIALANSGFIQIELIEQHDNTPSIYKEYLEHSTGGLQHISSWVTTEELRNKKAELLTLGYSIAQECTIPSSGVQLVYFSTENPSANFIFEIADLMEPNQYNRVQDIKSAYEQWNAETVSIEVGV